MILPVQRCRGISQQGEVRRELLLPFPSAATRLRDTTATPCGLALSMPMDYIDPLDKGAAIVGEARLAMNIDKLTEPGNIIWTDY